MFEDPGPDLQRYIRIRISSYYFTTTGTLASKFIYTIYFVKEFVVVKLKKIHTIIKITVASSSREIKEKTTFCQ